MGDHVPAHVERILEDFRVIALGLDRALTMLAEADHRVESSINAAHCGGYVAVIGQLRAAQDGIRQARASLGSTHNTVGSTAETISWAPKELSAAQIVAILTPASEKTDSIRNDIAATQAILPDIIHRVASAANENPAIGILGTLGQQILGILLDRAATAKQNIDTAITDARRTQSGE